MRKKFPSLWLRKCVCWVQIRNGGEILFYGQGKAKNLFGGVGQGRGQAHTAYIYNHNCYYDHNHCSVLSYCSNTASWIGKIQKPLFFAPPPPRSFDHFLRSGAGLQGCFTGKGRTGRPSLVQINFFSFSLSLFGARRNKIKVLLDLEHFFERSKSPQKSKPLKRVSH